jgi:hypothetical protein
LSNKQEKIVYKRNRKLKERKMIFMKKSKEKRIPVVWYINGWIEQHLPRPLSPSSI